MTDLLYIWSLIYWSKSSETIEFHGLKSLIRSKIELSELRMLPDFLCLHHEIALNARTNLPHNPAVCDSKWSHQNCLRFGTHNDQWIPLISSTNVLPNFNQAEVHPSVHWWKRYQDKVQSILRSLWFDYSFESNLSCACVVVTFARHQGRSSQSGINKQRGRTYGLALVEYLFSLRWWITWYSWCAVQGGYQLRLLFLQRKDIRDPIQRLCKLTMYCFQFG